MRARCTECGEPATPDRGDQKSGFYHLVPVHHDLCDGSTEICDTHCPVNLTCGPLLIDIKEYRRVLEEIAVEAATSA